MLQFQKKVMDSVKWYTILIDNLDTLVFNIKDEVRKRKKDLYFESSLCRKIIQYEII